MRSKHPLYNTWISMIHRCTNPKRSDFERYGGRGISVCERWLDFWDFVEDIGPRPSSAHSLDRINNDGNYEPSNVRWATQAEQSRNTSRNKIVTIDGTSMVAVDAAERTGVSPFTVYARLRRGVAPLERDQRAKTTRAHGSPRSHGARLDLSGATFGRWRVLAEAEPSARGERRWRVRCACGVEKTVLQLTLTRRSRATRSCGCLKSDLSRARMMGNKLAAREPIAQEFVG